MIRYGVDVGRELLALAGDVAAIAIVANAKNAGKTTAAAALVAAMQAPFGIVSAGRDGERYDEVDARKKPRLRLPAGTLFATARMLLPRSPACEIVATTGERGALGPIVLACARAAGEYEVAGPATAAGLRRVIDLIRAAGCPRVIVDGAADRVSALRGGDAVIVAVAPQARDEEAVAALASAMSARLRTPAADPSRPWRRLDGALTAVIAASLLEANERAQIVVADATRILAPAGALAGLDLRTSTPLRPVACVVNSIAGDLALDPSRLLAAVSQATALPAFDVFAGAVSAP